METKKFKTLDMVYTAMFAVIMAVCSWISIPATVPFTLQTFGVFLAVGVLGGKLIRIDLPFIGSDWGSGLCRLCRRSYRYFGQYGRLHSRISFLSACYVGNGSAFGQKNLGTDAFHGSGTVGMLCVRNGLVYDSLCKEYRSNRTYDGAWMVRVPLYHSGCDKNRAGIGDL